MHRIIEKYFWVLLLAALALGLSFPVYNAFFMKLLVPELMIMLLFVFLKTDLIKIFERVKNYKLMMYLSLMYLVIVPVLFYFLINFVNSELAVGVLLITAMPAGISTPVLSDIMKGNVAFSISIVIITSILAPFTVPLLFKVLDSGNLAINPFDIFQTLAIIVFVPALLSGVMKRFFLNVVEKVRPYSTTVNIFLLSLITYATVGSQRELILGDPAGILYEVGFLYLIFFLLHGVGYLIGFGQKKEDKISIMVGKSYMNNGMAIVLAATYFGPAVLVLVVLSELPWNTLPAVFRRILWRK